MGLPSWPPFVTLQTITEYYGFIRSVVIFKILTNKNCIPRLQKCEQLDKKILIDLEKSDVLSNLTLICSFHKYVEKNWKQRL